jgi:broad specificity phosphatase PhoE
MLRAVRRRLYLMRHAEVSYVGQRDPEVVRLTERGREQAAAAYRGLADVALDLVVTSNLPRTVETAAIVAPGREPEQWDDFAELRGGRLDDIPREELEQVSTATGGTALAVLHGGTNRILLSHALAGGRAYFGTFEQAPACINVLDLGGDGNWIVRTVNYIPYDPLHPARETTMEHLWEELSAWIKQR